MTKKLYCNICENTTPHKYRGVQNGVPGRTLELYDCLVCEDTCGGLGRKVNSHLLRWMNTGLGREYLRRRL